VASTAASPTAATADLIAGFLISGCGARVEPPPGPAPAGGPIDRQMLTAIFPNTSPNGVASGCQAKASDNGAPAPGSVSAYAINLLLDRDELGTVYPNNGSVGTVVTIEGARLSSDMKVQFVSQSNNNSAIVSASLLPDSVHRATMIVPNLPPGSYTLNVLQADVAGLGKGLTFVVQ
jgi:IPT/TIG domain